MNDTEFEDLLDRHGADLSSWPKDAGRAAQTLVASSAGAQALLRQAQDTATLLADALPAIEPIGLKTRILANTDAEPARGWLDWLTAALWRPVTLGLVPLALGFALGVSFPESAEEFDDDGVSLLVFVDLDDYSAADFGVEYEQ